MAQLYNLTVFCGPMKSGKSKPLIEQFLEEHVIRQGQPIAFRLRNSNDDAPLIKTRFFELSIPAYLINQEEEILTILNEHKGATLVLIDEIQFLGSMTVSVLAKILKNCPVIAAGLDLNYRALPFGPTGAVLAMAQEVHKLTAICDICHQNNGRYTQRLTNGQPASAYESEVIPEGSTDEVLYQARCAVHYQPPSDLDDWLKSNWI